MANNILADAQQVFNALKTNNPIVKELDAVLGGAMSVSTLSKAGQEIPALQVDWKKVFETYGKDVNTFNARYNEKFGPFLDNLKATRPDVLDVKCANTFIVKVLGPMMGQAMANRGHPKDAMRGWFMPDNLNAEYAVHLMSAGGRPQHVVDSKGEVTVNKTAAPRCPFGHGGNTGR